MSSAITSCLFYFVSTSLDFVFSSIFSVKPQKPQIAHVFEISALIGQKVLINLL